jgi:hypothetical protein
MTEHRRRLDNLESRLARVEQKNEITPPKGLPRGGAETRTDLPLLTLNRPGLRHYI